MKLFFLVVTCLVITSCKSDQTPPNPDPIHTDSTAVSGKLRKVIASYIGIRRADIFTITYDVSGRVSVFREERHDSSVTPIRVWGFNIMTFQYNGTSDRPAKVLITDSTSIVDSTVYRYDNQNRLIQDDYYHTGTLYNRNTFQYVGANTVIRERFHSTGTGVPNVMGRRDSIIYDAQGNLREMHGTSSSWKETYSYDNKVNPFSKLSFSKHINTFYVDDSRFTYRTPNNINNMLRTGFDTGSLNNTFIYSSNGYPVRGTIKESFQNHNRHCSVSFEYY